MGVYPGVISDRGKNSAMGEWRRMQDQRELSSAARQNERQKPVKVISCSGCGARGSEHSSCYYCGQVIV